MAETPSRRCAACAATPGTTPSKVSAPACAQTTSKPVGSGIRQASKALSRSSAANVPSPPSSSDPTATSTTSPWGARPPSAASACSAAATAPFMSTVPRPYRPPSWIAPDHGEPWRHASLPGGTTSTWPQSARRGACVRAPGTVSVRPQSSARGASSPGWSGCARSGARWWRWRSAPTPRAAAISASRSSAGRSSPVTLATSTSAPTSRAIAAASRRPSAASSSISPPLGRRELGRPRGHGRRLRREPRLAHAVGDRAHVGHGRRLEDVGRDARAAGRLAVVLDDDGYLAERVLAARDRLDAEVAQARVDAGRGVHGAEDRVDRAVAGERPLEGLAVGRAHRHRRVRRPARRGLDVEPLQRVGGDVVAKLVGDECLQVHRGDLLLLFRELLEALERLVQRLALDLVAELLERLAQRVAAGVLAEHDCVRVDADRRRVHDLVGRALLEHAVLVDPGLVDEGVAPDDRLVGLHRVAGETRDEAARARDLGGDDA